MKVICLDTDILQPQVVETEGGLAEWYRLIKCDLIDIVSRKIGGRYYDIIVDDEGLYKGGAKPTALDAQQQPQLVGNLVICNTDGEGNEATLTDEDIQHILKHIVVLTEAGTDQPQKWLALNGIEP